MSKTTVVVIGAGVVGLSLGRSLLREGAEVTLVASPEPREEIGWATVAWSNASSKVRRGYPDHYVRLNVHGVEAVRLLAEEIGGSWLQETGTLEIAAGEEAGAKLATDVERLDDEFGYPSEMLTRRRVAELADVTLRADETAAFFPRDALIDPVAMVGRLDQAFRGAGGRLVRDRVVGFERTAEAIRTIRLAGGAELSADRVVFAAGAWTRDVAALAGIDVAMLPRDDDRVIGLVVAVTRPEPGPERMILAPEIMIRPVGRRRVLLASDRDDATVDPASGREELRATAERRLERAAARVPALGRSEVLDLRLGMRALSADGMTIAGAPSNTANAYVLTTHSGFTLAPLLGELAAAEICRGEDEEALAPYRPARFDTG
jgi:glycine/D-amino acid oxidase-like deaminating enzyme